jgi:hypothetical protein
LALLTAADEGQLVRSSSTCSWACSCMLLLLSHGYPAQKNYKLIHIDVLSEIWLHPIWMCIWLCTLVLIRGVFCWCSLILLASAPHYCLVVLLVITNCCHY